MKPAIPPALSKASATPTTGDYRHQAIAEALNTALDHIQRQPSPAAQNLQKATASARRALSLLKQSCTDAAAMPATNTDTPTDALRFARIKAAFAQQGHTLHRSGTQPDALGEVSYVAVQAGWGLSRHLDTLEQAEKFLIQIGGKCHE